MPTSNLVLLLVKFMATSFALAYGVVATFHDDKLHTSVDGKKALSTIGKAAFMFLIVSSLFALVYDGVKEYKAADDARRQQIAEDQATAALQKLQNGMRSTLASLGGQTERTKSIADTLKRQSAQTEIIGKDLSKTSETVAASAESAKRSAAALSRLLSDNRMALTAYNVRLLVAFDAIVFDDCLHQTLLAPDLRAALETNVALLPLDQTRIVDALNDHRHEIREVLFRRWEMTFHMMKRDKAGALLFVQDLQFTGDEGASTYFTPPDSRIRTPQGRAAVGCLIRYTVPLAIRTNLGTGLS
jgi:hypothetical protein